MTLSKLDLSPFYRTSIGFDRLFNEINHRFDNSAIPAYPPYNIVKLNDDAFRVEIAVAGFAENEIEITVEDKDLVVIGRRDYGDMGEPKNEPDYVYKGIAARDFVRSFKLGDWIEVNSATIVNGILHIELIRNVPEAQKPKRIAISATTTRA